MPATYLLHRVETVPLGWKSVADRLAARRRDMEALGGRLYGIWRNQIGRPRDEVTVITLWRDVEAGPSVMAEWLAADDAVRAVDSWAMTPTSRPETDSAPVRQGNFAFRFFRTPPKHWDEFLDLCASAWPGFEASYEDCQIIGLWRFETLSEGLIDSLLLTRRPDLASWERTKIPRGALEAEVRAKLSRRYDLCESTYVHTTTLLTAVDAEDRTRWM